MMKLTKLLLTLMSGALLMCANGAQADTLTDIQQHGVLRVAVPQDFPPFGSVDAELRPQGLDIDVATLIARKLGVKVELIPVTSANRVPYLQTRKVDLIISSLGKNPERERVLDFSAAYAPFFNGVFGAADQKVTGPADLAGKTIGVTRGSVEDLELSKIAPASASIKRYEDNNGTISSFLSNQVQLVATGNVIAAAIIAKNPPKKPQTKFLIKDSPCFIGLNKDEKPLLDKLNAILTDIKKDGELNMLTEKWLGLPLPANM